MARKIKLSKFAEAEGLSYRQALSLFNQGHILGLKVKSTNTILVTGWNPDSIEQNFPEGED